MRKFFTKKRRKKLLKWGSAALAIYIIVSYLLLPSGAEYLTEAPLQWSMLNLRLRESARQGKAPRISHNWIPIAHISPNLTRAVIASEDLAFFDHSGIDFGEMFKVIRDTLFKLKMPRGASTITQQLAKNLYLADSWGPIRKLKEFVVARRLEAKLSKKRIMEIYLNIIEWGDGIYGAEAAAKFYFKKSASQLSEDEGAFLSAIIPNPKTKYNPSLNPSGVKTRQKIIRVRMERIALPWKF